MGECLTFGVCAATLTTSDGPVAVNNWGYRLQGSATEGGELRTNALAAATHHLLVMDFARYGDEGSKFTTKEISDIKNSVPSRGGDGHRKVVAAYVSIGEASDFRSYWDPVWTVGSNASDPLAPGAPSWLGPVNPDWPESRKVRYWELGWQDIIYGSGTAWLDQVVAQGFDAAYLDIVDAYYFWAVELDAGDRLPGDPTDGDKKDAAQRMIDFIVGMINHARQTNADFFVIPQNGEFIIDALEDQDPTRKAKFLNAIGAIGAEDTYFMGGSDENNSFSLDTDKIDILTQDFLGNGQLVFAVDYVNDAGKVQQFYDESVDDGFIPYAAPDRDLDVLGSPYVVPEPFAVLKGDVGDDGSVNNLDITPFIAALSAADEAAFLTQFPNGNYAAADIDMSGSANNLDITPFIGLLTAASATPVPEPSSLACIALALMMGRRRRPT